MCFGPDPTQSAKLRRKYKKEKCGGTKIEERGNKVSSTSFRWLLMFTSGDSDRFTLICTHFAYITALWGPLRGPCHLFDPFFILCIYFYTILFCVGSTIEESTFFFRF
jgi:hypothetical protein